MRVLVACEFSGVVRDAFRALGHDAWSCDLLPCEGDPRWHIQHDVMDVIGNGWDLMIAHPPCTRLTNSGVRWLDERNLWAEMYEAADFFRRILELPIAKIAVENPIPHRYALERIGRKYDQIVQPHQFGHPETKATCLWLKNLPPLIPTNDVRAVMKALPARERNRVHYASPGPDRWKIRSVTYAGIANAMADQWGAVAQQEAA